ncbi:MAG: 2,3-bisphosphoglycerate-independent phosphoglycerate mutase [Myxococcota bacterium]|jgi:2,3-bisphosphoglycerate-independent phosphoglycerate mutase
MVTPLAPHPTLRRPTGPVVLCILDGVGIGDGGPDDAVATARTPTLDRLRATCPFVPLAAHGIAVGLPSDADMGNSEVGHNAMGAGRVFDQGAKLVDHALASGDAFTTPVWRRLIAAPTLHLLGLVSDGNVHSHVDHLHLLIDRALSDGVRRLRVHVLTDGRDVAQRSALTWVEPLEARLAELSRSGVDYSVASGGGRMHITMDRYQADWAMVHRGWNVHVHGEGRQFSSAAEAIRAAYADDAGTDDQWLPGFVVADADGPVGRIASGDGVLFFNFRGDRAIEITEAFTSEDFPAFDRGDRPTVFYAGMMQYDGDRMLPTHYLVQPPAIDRTVGEYLVAARLRTFAVSETQKFGHVTFFFNGNRSGRLDDTLEEYVEVPSDTLPFDERPWMKAAEITDAAVAAIRSGRFDHVRLNLANGDMVGHTGELEATRLAVEAVDLCVGRLEAAVRAVGGVMIVTADHGNADGMWTRTKSGEVATDASGAPQPRTSHTLAPVPCILVDESGMRGLRQEPAGLASVGTSVLQLCGLTPPDDYAPGLIEPR